MQNIFQVEKYCFYICRRFDVLLFTVLAQLVANMIAVVVVQFITVPTGRWRSIDGDRRYRSFSTGRSLVHLTDTRAGLHFRDSFWVFRL